MSQAPPVRFEPDPAEYEALIDWPRRLEREAPFFRHYFGQVGARRVLDAACGTGRHAAMFRDWGLDVVGADVSAAMIAHCRTCWGETDRLRWIEHSFDRHHKSAPFDAAICIGNSLAIASDPSATQAALSAMLGSLRAGGVLIIQILNAWRIPEGPIVWEKCKHFRDGPIERWLLKGLHRVGERYFVEFVSGTRHGEEVRNSLRSATLRAMETGELLEMARQSGAEDIAVLGGYDQHTYDRHCSQDIILVGRRRATS